MSPRRSIACSGLMLLALSLVGCRGGTSPAGDGAPPFGALRAQWAGDLEAKQLDQAVGMYAADAEFLEPDGTHVTGTKALRGRFQSVMLAFDSHLVWHSRSTGYSGGMGFDSGSFEETLRVKATGGDLHLTGDYLTVYRRGPDGRWLIVEQAWTQAVKQGS